MVINRGAILNLPADGGVEPDFTHFIVPTIQVLEQQLGQTVEDNLKFYAKWRQIHNAMVCPRVGCAHQMVFKKDNSNKDLYCVMQDIIDSSLRYNPCKTNCIVLALLQ